VKVEEEGPFRFSTQAQQVFFMEEEQNPYWKVVVQKESRSSQITTNRFLNSSGIDDGVPWLNTPAT